ncbi:MAG TPA: hypothetical protein VFA38_06480 [Nitrospirales bacterium]|nr:hypothetical protein [Nitrospirales bacterium]
MALDIPEHHPLRRLFGTITERSFTEQLGWPDVNITEYVSNLLVEFTRTDQLFRIKNAGGETVESVVDLLYESEVLYEATSVDRERDVHRHIGDFTLFMTGIFPEYLRRLKAAGPIYHKDFLVDYVKTGKRSYAIVAEHGDSDRDGQTGPLFQKLSENFELCVTGLGFVRTELERLRDSSFQRTKHSLLN